MQRCCQQILVALRDTDLRPVRRRAGVIYIRQAATAAERITADAGHAVRYRHRRQPRAAAERRAADTGHAARDRHGRQ